jgi:SAM-dependent methyltransferase
MDRDFWQEKYTNQATGWDLGAVSPPLKAYFDQLTNKDLKILIPGCGYGHEAIYLFQHGFTNVTVIDLVGEALQVIKQKAPAVHCIQGDVFEMNAHFDIIVEQTLFCAINPIMRETYIAKMAQLLSNQGKYVGLLFNREFDGGPPFGGNVSEYNTYFTENFSEYKTEACYNSATPRSGNEVFFIAKK